MAHTPGPWLYDDNHCQVYSQLPKDHVDRWSDDPDLDDGKRRVLCAYGAMGGEDSSADLDLIVAAPELLAALEGLCDAYSDHVEAFLNRELKPRDLPKEFHAARAAIAKARGETEEGQSDDT